MLHLASSFVPAVVVLRAEGQAVPETVLDRYSDQVEFRVTDAAGLASALPGASALLIWDFFSPALREAWPAADALRWVHVAAAGVDAVLFPALRESSVVVTNARGVFDRPIAEFVAASVLAHAKQLHLSRDLQRERVWRHRETSSLRDRRALVVGTGPIGRASARMLAAIGLSVRGAGRVGRTGDPDFGEVVPSAALVDHVGDVDYLVLAAPLTEATRGLLDATVLAALPRRAHVVNVGRGALVDAPALQEALAEGRIDGASLDVFDDEPLPPDSPWWGLPGVVVSPHLSGDVVGWRDALAEQFADNLERWLAGKELSNEVDKRLGYVPGGGHD
ncbi:MAG: D-2-hydroxyacid dehydrogenase [Nocardioides sp.]|nr:D-2-hydroxyacid dehydrogenase [Nocardioides sp.]